MQGFVNRNGWASLSPDRRYIAVSDNGKLQIQTRAGWEAHNDRNEEHPEDHGGVESGFVALSDLRNMGKYSSL